MFASVFLPLLLSSIRANEVADSKNSSCLLQESASFWNGTHLKDIHQDCQNGTTIQKLLLDPSLTYNISFIDDIIPYFSDVRIYFADGINNCTCRFKEFIKAKNNILTNNDIYHFMSHNSTCWEYAFYNNQFCVTLYKYDNKFALYHKKSNFPIHFTQKHQSCKEEFIQYVYLSGFHTTTTDTFILNIDNLNNFSQENNCFDILFPCPSPEYNDMRFAIPDTTTTYVQLVIAVEVTVVNTFVLLIFLQKDNRTPVTILLSALALSDTTAALLMTVPIFIANQIYDDRRYHQNGYSWLFILEFPECFIIDLSAAFRYAFHVTSILITLLLCLQKTAALLFPIWTKIHLNNRVSIVCSVLTFAIAICIYSQVFYDGASKFKNFHGRCCIRNDNIDHELLVHHLTSFNVCILLACLIVSLCTIYIICKLTVLRRKLPWTDSAVLQRRTRISAITVVLICIVFLLSELPLIVTFFINMLMYFNPSMYTRSDLRNKGIIKRYNDLILIIGFSLNFTVYIMMSKQLRDKLWTGDTKTTRRCKCW